MTESEELESKAVGLWRDYGFLLKKHKPFFYTACRIPELANTTGGIEIMASPTFEGCGKCDRCKKKVDVYSNINGLAYYNCGPCGFRGQDRVRKTSDAFLAGLDREAEADDGPPAATQPAAPPPKPVLKQAPKAALKKEPAVVPDETKPEPKKSGGFFANLVLG